MTTFLNNKKKVSISGVYSNMGLDQNTGTLQTIEYDHHEIHSGSSFVQCGQKSIAQASSYSILVKTPDTTKYAHLAEVFRSTQETNIKIYEDTATSADGTSLSVFNRNRNSTNTNTVTVTHTPTLSTTGVLICEIHIGSGRTAGGEARGVSEFILKRNTKYLLLVTNEAAGSAADFSYSLNWYEHTDIA